MTIKNQADLDAYIAAAKQNKIVSEQYFNAFKQTVTKSNAQYDAIKSQINAVKADTTLSETESLSKQLELRKNLSEVLSASIAESTPIYMKMSDMSSAGYNTDNRSSYLKAMANNLKQQQAGVVANNQKNTELETKINDLAGAAQAKKTDTLTSAQTAALPANQVSNVQQTGLDPIGATVDTPGATPRDIQPVVLGSDPAPGTASELLKPEESIINAQKTGENFGENAEDAFRRGQQAPADETNNIPNPTTAPTAVGPEDPAAFKTETNNSVLAAIKPADDDLNNRTFARSPNDEMSDAAAEAAKPEEPPIPVPPLDWRVKLELASKSDWATTWFESDDAKILKPLSETKGVVFPYTPTIQMGYKAQYDSTDITHSNYKLSFYKNSYVDDISISAVFTAQDTVEANYLLATMHFFKTVTKMFYGKDTYPIAGTPPPLLFLTGYGKYQFDHLPLVLTSFTFTLPDDVDYIRTNTDKTWSGTTIGIQESNTPASPKPKSPVRDWLNKTLRLNNNNLAPGGEKVKPVFTSMNLNNNDSTYVPTKISFSLTLKPIVTRGNISKNYSTQGYAQKGGYW